MAGLGSKQRARISRERRGLQASRDGAHAVDEVLDYRRKRSGGIEIFVSWVGVDKSTGAAFSPEWTSLRKASTEVRVEAHALIAKATARRVAVKRKASTTLGVKWKKGYVPPPTWVEDLVISFEIPGADSDEEFANYASGMEVEFQWPTHPTYFRSPHPGLCVAAADWVQYHSP